MRNYRTLQEVTEEYFTKHPNEVEDFLKLAFDQYAKEGDTATLLAELRIIARVKGITKMAEEIGMTRQGLQKALSPKGNPRLDNINSIMQAMGYQLMPQKIDLSTV